MARIESAQTLVGKTVTRLDGTQVKIAGLLLGGYKMASGPKLSARNLVKRSGKFVEIEKTDIRQLQDMGGYVSVTSEKGKPEGKTDKADKTEVKQRTPRVPRVQAKPDHDLEEIGSDGMNADIAKKLMPVLKDAVAKAFSSMFSNEVGSVVSDIEYSHDAFQLRVGLKFEVPEAVEHGSIKSAEVPAKAKKLVTAIPSALTSLDGFEDAVSGSVLSDDAGLEYILLGVDADGKAVLLTEDEKVRRVPMSKLSNYTPVVEESEDGDDLEDDEEIEEEDLDDDEEQEEQEDGDDNDNEEDEDDEEFTLAVREIDSQIMSSKVTTHIETVSKKIAAGWGVEDREIVPGLVVVKDVDQDVELVVYGLNAEGKIILVNTDSGKVRPVTVESLIDNYSPVANGVWAEA